jgi:hypothetical protein
MGLAARIGSSWRFTNRGLIGLCFSHYSRSFALE